MAIHMSEKAAKHAEVAHKLYDLYNSREFDRSLEHLTDDVEITSIPFGQTFKGRSGVLDFLNGWAAAFPDSKVEVTKVVADEHCAVVEFIARGTQTGTLKSPAGDIPPTGKAVEFRFCDVHEFEGGKSHRQRSYFDSATMLRQLGLVK